MLDKNHLERVAKNTTPLITPLNPNERGLIVTSKSSRSSSLQFGEHISSAGVLSRELVAFGLTFWDRLVWPQVGDSFAGKTSSRFTPTEEALAKNGVLLAPIYNLPYIDSFVFSEGFSVGGSSAEALLEYQRSVFRNLIARDPGRWCYSSESRELLREYNQQTDGGFRVELTEAIPIVSDIGDIDDFLKWRESRKDIIRRLHLSVSSIISDIEAYKGDRVEEAIKERAGEVFVNSAELLRVTKERDPSFRFLGLNLYFSFRDLVTSAPSSAVTGGTIGGWTFGPSAVLPGAALGLFADLAAKISIVPDKRTQILNDVSFPYAMVPMLQYQKKK